MTWTPSPSVKKKGTQTLKTDLFAPLSVHTWRPRPLVREFRLCPVAPIFNAPPPLTHTQRNRSTHTNTHVGLAHIDSTTWGYIETEPILWLDWVCPLRTISLWDKSKINSVWQPYLAHAQTDTHTCTHSKVPAQSHLHWQCYLSTV